MKCEDSCCGFKKKNLQLLCSIQSALCSEINYTYSYKEIIPLLAHKYYVVIIIRTLKKTVQKSASAQNKKSPQILSWPDLYKAKWLAMDKCKETMVTLFCNKENVCCITQHDSAKAFCIFFLNVALTLLCTFKLIRLVQTLFSLT